MDLRAAEVFELAASEAAEYAARARLTDSLSEKSLAESESCFVDSFHSFDALNSFDNVSVNTCHGVLSPWGGGGGSSDLAFCSDFASFDFASPEVESSCLSFDVCASCSGSVDLSGFWFSANRNEWVEKVRRLEDRSGDLMVDG